MNEPDQLAPCWHFAWEQAEAALVDDDLSGHSSCSSPSYRAPLGFAPGDWDESPREQLQRIHPDELARVLEAQAALQSPGASLDPLRRDPCAIATSRRSAKPRPTRGSAISSTA